MNDNTQPNHVPDDPDTPALDPRDSDLDALCERWVYWCRSRRLYWPDSSPAAALARQSGGTRPLRHDSDAVSASESLAALHIAYTCQPNSLDKQVFDLYYVARVKPVKTAAAALGIGRTHFYRLLVEFRRRLASAALAFEQEGAQVAPLVVRDSLSSTLVLSPEFQIVNKESVSSGGDTLGN